MHKAKLCRVSEVCSRGVSRHAQREVEVAQGSETVSIILISVPALAAALRFPFIKGAEVAVFFFRFNFRVPSARW